MESKEPTALNKADIKRAPGKMNEKEEILANAKMDNYDYLANSAAGMDCTGLMNRTPEDEAEMENYQQVYQYLPPNVKVDSQKSE